MMKRKSDMGDQDFTKEQKVSDPAQMARLLRRAQRFVELSASLTKNGPRRTRDLEEFLSNSGEGCPREDTTPSVSSVHIRGMSAVDKDKWLEKQTRAFAEELDALRRDRSFNDRSVAFVAEMLSLGSEMS